MTAHLRCCRRLLARSKRGLTLERDIPKCPARHEKARDVKPLGQGRSFRSCRTIHLRKHAVLGLAGPTLPNLRIRALRPVGCPTCTSPSQANSGRGGLPARLSCRQQASAESLPARRTLGGILNRGALGPHSLKDCEPSRRGIAARRQTELDTKLGIGFRAGGEVERPGDQLWPARGLEQDGLRVVKSTQSRAYTDITVVLQVGGLD